MHHKVGSVFVSTVVLVLRLLLHALQIASQFRAESLESSCSAQTGPCRAAAGRVEPRRLRSRGSRLTVVDALRIGRNAPQAEVQPGRAGLLQTDAQMLQITSLETGVELSRHAQGDG